ncbi:hypothetical protein BDR22DRAFT_893704 [Usnea florida]
MSPNNACRLATFLVLLQTLTIITSAHPLISLLNTTTIHTPSTSLELPVPQNGTTSNHPQNTFDYRIVGTPLILRITELGFPFSAAAIETIIDASIQRVVRQINNGAGKQPIERDRFEELSREIELRIDALAHGGLNYFLLGDVLAGIWQYMNEPWGGFMELTFDVLIIRAGYNYIGYGRLQKNGPPPPPTPSEAPFSSSQKRDLRRAIP